jgi:hypothetical protein
VKIAAITWARYQAPFLSVSATAQTHLVPCVGIWVLLDFPIVQTKTALPRFGHAQIVPWLLLFLASLCPHRNTQVSPSFSLVSFVIRLGCTLDGSPGIFG